MRGEGVKHPMTSVRRQLPPSKCSFHVCLNKDADFNLVQMSQCCHAMHQE